MTTGEAKRPTRIACRTYTEPVPVFSLYKEQVAAVKEWMDEHDRIRHPNGGGSVRITGAIGGAYTYRFTPTQLGWVVCVACSCGEEVDVSDYDNW